MFTKFDSNWNPNETSNLENDEQIMVGCRNEKIILSHISIIPSHDLSWRTVLTDKAIYLKKCNEKEEDEEEEENPNKIDSMKSLLESDMTYRVDLLSVCGFDYEQSIDNIESLEYENTEASVFQTKLAQKSKLPLVTLQIYASKTEQV